ncbi:FDXHR family putative zinc-binding protein [Epidermidibacterium keratini]
MTEQFQCRKCGSGWGGLNTCHCQRCHVTFSTVANFDRHQRGGECLTPKDAGLVRNGRRYECYGQPGEQERAARMQGKDSGGLTGVEGLPVPEAAFGGVSS